MDCEGRPKVKRQIFSNLFLCNFYPLSCRAAHKLHVHLRHLRESGAGFKSVLKTVYSDGTFPQKLKQCLQKGHEGRLLTAI